METEEPQGRRRQKGCHYSVDPGCKNEFYSFKAKYKTMHLHKLTETDSTAALASGTE